MIKYEDAINFIFTVSEMVASMWYLILPFVAAALAFMYFKTRE